MPDDRPRAGKTEARNEPPNGALNFRDLGGFAARQGRRVRRGLIFRSGSLDGLTATGTAQLAALGVSAIYDLRSDPERAARPPRLPADGSITHLFFPHERQTGNLFAALREPGRSPDDARAVMLRIYRHLPFDLAPAYRQLFRRIIDEPSPIVFNCAAGKDRTGFAAALLLHALGVSASDVREDYLRSLEALEAIRAMFMTGPRAPTTSAVAPAIWEPILRVDAAYLDTAFAAVEGRCGSLMGFLSNALGVTEEDVARLRARLLE